LLNSLHIIVVTS